MNNYIIHVNRVEKTEWIEAVEDIVARMREEGEEVSQERYYELIDVFAKAIINGGKLIVPVKIPKSLEDEMIVGMPKVGDEINLKEEVRISIKKIELPDGTAALAAFTDYDKLDTDQPESTMTEDVERCLERALMIEEVDGLMINPWTAPCFLPKGYIKMIFEKCLEVKDETRVTFTTANIARYHCECIVNAANKTLLGGGGVDGAIHREAGPGLLEECRTLGGCETGQAKITGGHALMARYMIHTVGPVYTGKETDAQMLGRCYWNSLELARSKNIHSIAFPAISTGAYRYPFVPAAEVAVRTVFDWLKINPQYAMRVTFVLSSRENADVYRAVWADYAAEYDADLTAGANDGILERAVSFAMEAHRGAVRKGSDRPYILHPIETLGILASMNADINLMAAGVLHDTLEDTDTSLLDIYEQFGADTAALVNAHTEDKRRCWFLRKLHTVNEIPNLDIRMKMLVIADKVANLRNMYSDYKKIGEELWTRFNAPKALQAWYYGSINDSLAELADYVETRDIYWEMTALFKDLFVDYFIDDENDVIYQASADKTIYMLCRSDCCWRQTEEGLPDGLRQIHRKAAERIEDNWTEE